MPSVGTRRAPFSFCDVSTPDLGVETAIRHTAHRSQPNIACISACALLKKKEGISLLKQNESRIASLEFWAGIFWRRTYSTEDSDDYNRRRWTKCHGTCVIAVSLLTMSLRSRGGWLDRHKPAWPRMHYRASIIWYDSCRYNITIIICDPYQSNYQQ